MITLLFSVMSWLVVALPTVLMIGWIVSLADPSGSWAVTRFLSTITLPYFHRVNGMLPRIGQLDISPLLIWILSIIVNRLLAGLAF